MVEVLQGNDKNLEQVRKQMLDRHDVIHKQFGNLAKRGADLRKTLESYRTQRLAGADVVVQQNEDASKKANEEFVKISDQAAKKKAAVERRQSENRAKSSKEARSILEKQVNDLSGTAEKRIAAAEKHEKEWQSNQIQLRTDIQQATSETLEDIERRITHWQTQVNIAEASFAQLEQERVVDIRQDFVEGTLEIAENVGFFQGRPSAPIQTTQESKEEFAVRQEKFLKDIEAWRTKMRGGVQERLDKNQEAFKLQIQGIWQPGGNVRNADWARFMKIHNDEVMGRRNVDVPWTWVLQYQLGRVHLDRLQVLEKLENPTAEQAQEALLLRNMEAQMAQQVMMDALVGNFLGTVHRYGVLVENGDIPAQHRNLPLEQRSQSMIQFIRRGLPRFQQLRQVNYVANSLIFLQWQVAHRLQPARAEISACQKELATPNVPAKRQKELQARIQELNAQLGKLGPTKLETDQWNSCLTALATLNEQMRKPDHPLASRVHTTLPNGGTQTYSSLSLPPLGELPVQHLGSEAGDAWIADNLTPFATPVRDQMNDIEGHLRDIFSQTERVNLRLSNSETRQMSPHVAQAMFLRGLTDYSSALGQQLAKGALPGEARVKMTQDQVVDLIATDTRTAGFLSSYASRTLPLQRQLMILYATNGALLPRGQGAVKNQEATAKTVVMPAAYQNHGGFDLPLAQLGFANQFANQEHIITQYIDILTVEVSSIRDGSALDQFIIPIMDTTENMAQYFDSIATSTVQGANEMLDTLTLTGALRRSWSGDPLAAQQELHELARDLRAVRKTLGSVREEFRDRLRKHAEAIDKGVKELAARAKELSAATNALEAATVDVEAAQKRGDKAGVEKARQAFIKAARNRRATVEACTKAAEALTTPYEELAKTQEEYNKRITEILDSASVNWRLWEGSRNANWGEQIAWMVVRPFAAAFLIFRIRDIVRWLRRTTPETERSAARRTAASEARMLQAQGASEARILEAQRESEARIMEEIRRVVEASAPSPESPHRTLAQIITDSNRVAPGREGGVPERFGLAFDRLGQLEIEARLLPEVERAAALEIIHERRVALIGQMLDAHYQVPAGSTVAPVPANERVSVTREGTITPEQWRATQTEAARILAGPDAAQLHPETRAALQAIVDRATPPTMGEALGMVHEVGCRNRSALRAGLLRLLERLGITDVSVRTLLVDTGATGVPPERATDQRAQADKTAAQERATPAQDKTSAADKAVQEKLRTDRAAAIQRISSSALAKARDSVVMGDVRYSFVSGGVQIGPVDGPAWCTVGQEGHIGPGLPPGMEKIVNQHLAQLRQLSSVADAKLLSERGVKVGAERSGNNPLGSTRNPITLSPSQFGESGGKLAALHSKTLQEIHLLTDEQRKALANDPEAKAQYEKGMNEVREQVHKTGHFPPHTALPEHLQKSVKATHYNKIVEQYHKGRSR